MKYFYKILRAIPVFPSSLVFLVFLNVSCSHAPTSSVRNLQSTGAAEQDSFAESKINGLREEAYSFYKRGDYLRAIPFFELMKHVGEPYLTPTDYFVLGYIYLTLGEGPSADEAIRRGIRLSPYQSNGYQLLGLAEFSMGRFLKSSEHFKRGLEFDSHPPKLHFYLGLALGKTGANNERDKEFLKSEEKYEQILLQNVYDFASNFELAYIYLTLGHKISKVEELIENARLGLKESDPELVEGGMQYSQFYLPMIEGIEAFRKNNYEKADTLLVQAVISSPLGARADLAEIYRYLSLSAKELGKSELAVTYSQLERALDPNRMIASPHPRHQR